MYTNDEAKDLSQNIREARLQLNKLKQEVNSLEGDPLNLGNNNLKEYMKSATYSLSKNNNNIDKKIADYKAKLPSIHKQDKEEIDSSLMAGYKKFRKVTNRSSVKRNSEESTKVDHSFSFSIQNRPMKIHSNYEKHLKPEFSLIEGNQNEGNIPTEILKLKEQTTVGNEKKNEINLLAFNRQKRTFSSQKRRLKYFNLNEFSNIQDQSEIIKPPSSLEYNSIVDKFSKHEFMIINGKTANEGPEFLSYTRIYESIFTRIKEEINRLELLVGEKHIRFVMFDGKKLAYMCLQGEISKAELVSCLIDENGEVTKILIPESKYYGEKGRELAATKIQATYKMHITRQKYLILVRKSIVIQRFFKKSLCRLQLEKKIHERNSQIIDNFERKQENLTSIWREIKKGKRVEIHLNSIEADEEKRLSIENFAERENIQLSRIFRLKDENLIIIYISSSELPRDVINYYYKMLELAGIHKYEDRLLFFTPCNSAFFPNHYSVSKMLYYSSKTLNQLKIITEDLPTFLYPGYPSNELIKICDFLGCYLFSGDPQKMKPFTTRSQALTFLKNLSIPCLPSAMEMYDYGEFLNTFSVLITKNYEIKVWFLKIDDEFGGRGIGYLDLGKSKVVQNLLKQIEISKGEFFATDLAETHSEAHNEEITVRIRDYLKENLPERLKIVTTSVYRCYSEFMGRFIKKGGVIEAKPPMANKSILSFPSFSFAVDPTGEFEVFTSYEKIIGAPFRSYACSFPQKSLESKEAINIIRQICESFKIRKIFGYFTIDFVVYSEGVESNSSTKIGSKTNINGSKTKFWVLDIDPYINNYTASFFLFDVLMGGTYFPEKNMYLIEKEEEKSETFSLDTMASDVHQSYNGGLVERGFIFIPHFFNQNLYLVKIKEFFKQARVERFNFDVGNKEGLCILLLDSLTSGTMSLMAVSKNEFESVTLLKNVLEFIVKISGIKNVEYGRTESEPSTDRILIRDMLNLFLTMVRKEGKCNAKVKALKQFENNQKLELII